MHSVAMIHEVYWNSRSFTTKAFFIVIRDLLYLTICFCQFGHLQVNHTMYEILGRRLSAYNSTKGIVNSFLRNIVVVYTAML